jgi:hypothetical protein
MNTKLIMLAALNLCLPAYAQPAKNMPESTPVSQQAKQSQVVEKSSRVVTSQSEVKFNRQDYQQRIGTQIAQWDADLKALAEKAKTATAEAKADYDRQMAELRPKLENARVQFEQLRVASAEAFEDLRLGFESAYTDLSTAFGKMHSAVESAASKFQNNSPSSAAQNSNIQNQAVPTPSNVNQPIQSGSAQPAQPL